MGNQDFDFFEQQLRNARVELADLQKQIKAFGTHQTAYFKPGKKCAAKLKTNVPDVRMGSTAE